jgi:histidine triad (HIT) family protein
VEDCIFCKIANGEIPAEKLYEDDEIFVIKDINPLTPVHLLVIPKKHVPTLLDLEEPDAGLVGKVFLIARKVAQEAGVAEQGFRVVHNVNDWGGQKVFHMHFHVLGGVKLD